MAYPKLLQKLFANSGAGPKLRSDIIPTDEALDATSTNPVQNKVVTAALNNIDIPTVNLATNENAGLVKPDGSTITVDSAGVIKAVASSKGMQLFTENGVFTVPDGVKQVFVMCVGGGGGGGWYHNSGKTGGTTSFGTYATAPGGGGGYDNEVGGAAGAAGTATGTYVASAGNKGGTSGQIVAGITFSSGGWINTFSFGCGKGGTGSDATSVGGSGGGVAAIVPVTPGEEIQVTVGAGGTGAVAGLAGACYVEW